MGLRGKIFIVLCGGLLVSLLIMGGAVYYQSLSLALDELLDTTRKRLDKDALEIEKNISSLRQDLMVLADMPPVQGLIRAKDNGDTDALTGDKGAFWVSRLEKIFGAFLTNHPEYYKIRYIDEKGMELARVEAEGGKVRAVRGTGLRNKDRYPYFIRGLQLRQNEVYYSEVSLEREHGRIKEPRVSVFRVATPVFDKNKQVRGLIVINMRARALFDNIKSGEEGILKYVVNQDGYFIHHPDASREFGFDLGVDYAIGDAHMEMAAEMKLEDDNVKYHKEKLHVDGFKKVFFSPGDKKRYWAVVYIHPVGSALMKVYKTRNMIVFAGVVIIIFSLAAGLRCASKLNLKLQSGLRRTS